MQKSEISEKDIEVYLKDEIKAIGGRAYKFVSPGNRGVPDRMVCLPGGRIAFIELKAPGKKSTALQGKQQNILRALGFYVQVIDNKNQVDDLIGCFRGTIGK